MRTMTLLIAGAAFVFASSFAAAALITVDGMFGVGEWSGSTLIVANDPNEASIPDGYDIKYVCNLWDEAANTTFFCMDTYSPLPATTTNDFVALMIDADNDTTTGVNLYGNPGTDYYFYFNQLPTTTTPTYGSTPPDNYAFYRYNSGTTNWDMMSNALNWFSVSRNGASGDGVEWGINADAIGAPAEFTWGVFLDDGSTNPDDYIRGVKGHAPEPGTMALLTLGLAGLYLKRRRK